MLKISLKSIKWNKYQNMYKKKKTLDFISKFVKKTTIIHNNANIIKHFDNWIDLSIIEKLQIQ